MHKLTNYYAVETTTVGVQARAGHAHSRQTLLPHAIADGPVVA